MFRHVQIECDLIVLGNDQFACDIEHFGHKIFSVQQGDPVEEELDEDPRGCLKNAPNKAFAIGGEKFDGVIFVNSLLRIKKDKIA